MNKLKWNAGQIVNDTNEYELIQYPATDKPKYLVDYDFKDMEIARLNKIIDRARSFLNSKCYFNERALTFSECAKLYNMLDKEELKEEGKNE